jgi:hypothetical protein
VEICDGSIMNFFWHLGWLFACNNHNLTKIQETFSKIPMNDDHSNILQWTQEQVLNHS